MYFFLISSICRIENDLAFILKYVINSQLLDVIIVCVFYIHCASSNVNLFTRLKQCQQFKKCTFSHAINSSSTLNNKEAAFMCSILNYFNLSRASEQNVLVFYAIVTSFYVTCEHCV